MLYIISEVIESLAYDDFQDFNFTFFTKFHFTILRII